jgi:hypothetical protein
MNRYLTFLVIVTAILTGSCNGTQDGASGKIIPEDKMVSLLMDMHLTEAVLTKDDRAPDQKANLALSYYPSVLEKYDVTRAQVDSSVYWYTRHPKIYNRIYEKVVANLEKKLADVQPDSAK